jgi:arylsulfatase A-like enzyme
MSLEDEVRYTLGRKVSAPVFFSFSLPTDSEHSFSLSVPAPPIFQVGDRIALQIESTHDAVRKRHPTLLAEVEPRHGKPGIRLELPLPDGYANKTISLDVRGTAVPESTTLYHRTAPVIVPPDSYLDFSIGIEEAAWGEGPVEFQVRSCTRDECETLFQEIVDPSVSDERGWQARRLDLARLADRELFFSFESRLLSSRDDAFSFPVWANPTVYAPVESPDGGVNIILISLDTLAAEHLPTYGYEFQTAPFVDGVLARGGIVFDRAVAAATTTPQSHMSMFTSVQPCRHGITTGMERVRAGLLTLAEVLRAAGYETGAVTENGWLGYRHGFGRGFNFYAENKSANLMMPEGQIDATLATARRWVMRNGDKRFFLFLHTFQVHEPYIPPNKYSDLFRQRDGTEVGEASPRPLREIVAYDQEIRFTDDRLQGFFGFLRERRLLDDTVIIVTADHGEEFFEHGEQGHGRNLFDEVTRVPLIVWGPGRVPEGERSAETVGHIDLMPTILALAGVSSPAQVSGRDILAPASVERSAASEFRFTESRVEVAIREGYKLVDVDPPSFMVQRGHRKMVRYRESDGYTYEAYDLDEDPSESHNRLPADAVAFEPMKRLLDGYEAACARAVQQKNGGGVSRRIELDPEREKKLRALGYLD